MVQALSFLMSIPCLSAVLICLSVEKTRTEVSGVWKSDTWRRVVDWSQTYTGWGGNESLKGRNWEEDGSLEFLRK